MESEVVNLISQMGFPIVACCGIFYLYEKTIKEITATLNKMDTTLSILVQALHKLDLDIDATINEDNGGK